MIPVCPTIALPHGEAIRVEADEPIAVFNVDGEFYAIDDTCTHQDASLADGWLDGCAIECPLHASCFDLRTGLVSGPPAKVPVRTHRVTVEDGVVHVHPTPAAEGAPVTELARSRMDTAPVGTWPTSAGEEDA
jgi:3-phenylpropionate/trans-cinnamate dioxygenase ferredoxin component